jgi:4-diphosphocytidyl-2-C-methyl-D-erythritol kinase
VIRAGAGELAFAKVNLCLFLGPARGDGRHELVTLFSSIALTDALTIAPAGPGGADSVVCEGVSGPNLVADALAALREGGWAAPPLRVTIAKRIPVAAGMGGGSADAAAMLRCAPRLALVDGATVTRIAAGLGADVPAQLDPGPSIGTGAGEEVTAVGDLAAHGVLVLPQPVALSTPAVYREADRLGLRRDAGELSELARELAAAVRLGGPLPDALAVNDLGPAARSLCPAIDEALDRARDAGADQVLVCGSGPTSVGVFWGEDGRDRAARAAHRLRARYPEAVAAEPVRRGSRPSAPNH